MVSSPDQTQQAPFMLFLIIPYFERPASSVRLVKSIHLRAMLETEHLGQVTAPIRKTRFALTRCFAQWFHRCSRDAHSQNRTFRASPLIAN